MRNIQPKHAPKWSLRVNDVQLDIIYIEFTNKDESHT